MVARFIVTSMPTASLLSNSNANANGPYIREICWQKQSAAGILLEFRGFRRQQS
jgi:hypothetical protein